MTEAISMGGGGRSGLLSRDGKDRVGEDRVFPTLPTAIAAYHKYSDGLTGTSGPPAA